MAEVVCSLCTCRLEWNDVDTDELQCSVCGHSLDDDHAAADSGTPPSGTADGDVTQMFPEAKVI